MEKFEYLALIKICVLTSATDIFKEFTLGHGDQAPKYQFYLY